MKLYFEDRLDELEEYWATTIFGLINITIQNIRDDTDGSCTLEFTCNYHNRTSVDTILDDIKNDISSCTGIDEDRLVTTVYSHSKRALLSNSGGSLTVTESNSHSDGVQLYSSIIFLVGSLLLSHILSQ